jgi:hypothetical protein
MIILFDVDGVLIESLAYHAALKQTVAYFSRRLGLGELTLTSADIEVYESQSITVEWESGAMSVAALFVERLKALADPALDATLAPDFWTTFDQLPASSVTVPRPDFSALARFIGETTPAGSRAASTALTFFLEQSNQPGLSTLPAVALRLQDLLARCREIDHAPVMQIFQNYLLGHQHYTESYAVPAHFESEPLLKKLDRPYLAPAMGERLLARRAAGEIFPALYTARPSLAPLEVSAPPRGYTPESEIGRELVGLDAVPAMGYGKMDWLGREIGRRGGELVKPSPFHALAAIGAARSGLEVASLQAALAIEQDGSLQAPLAACAGETVHVFEDSAGGLRAATQAVEKLNGFGLQLRLVRHGIAQPGSPKRATLEKVTDMLHENVNEGLERILGTGG